MGRLFFITGGVRCGKSSYAEKLASELKTSNEILIYLACGVCTDREMEKRILKHRLDRQSSHEKWTTIERPLAIGDIVDTIPSNSIVLLDCLTTLLTNELFNGDMEGGRYVEDSIYESVIQLADRVKALLVVSNELFHDIPPETDEILQFQRTLGRLHRRLVEKSSIAIDMTVGIPVMKNGVSMK
ncbi:bifunctional adenosylcobinamide kinase/adenosylcobinamide-phosphate guanylyltransferase [Rossellomorea vietnamensis]|uniref:bifunctional adenosylcobinamide kinase/adenosylcobinamide-phosphate guanylyltransferase n=1 Tax=Rossellomorea vietnamensis TaxID=218284 RepID=UPI001E5B1C3A|nr:bifunctional adenosylcobinamide kinase/adenosylcobinamide-phosphate guanylyltransferase [Rossellomorea vietnamensis]MCC5800663.1 bifunctional adenosylcobinamide kinase/adenosylcobinamide-phosphate guanylyltransferase [Rossellomorea vietnamensis]